MQPSTPPGQVTRCVDDDGVIAISIVNSGHSKQFDSQPTLSASHARSHWSFGTFVLLGAGNRSLALDHGSVYRHDHRRKKRMPASPRARRPARPPDPVPGPRRCECRSAIP
jgi:hypothetical protein